MLTLSLHDGTSTVVQSFKETNCSFDSASSSSPQSSTSASSSSSSSPFLSTSKLLLSTTTTANSTTNSTNKNNYNLDYLSSSKKCSLSSLSSNQRRLQTKVNDYQIISIVRIYVGGQKKTQYMSLTCPRTLLLLNCLTNTKQKQNRKRNIIFLFILNQKFFFKCTRLIC